MLAVRGLRNHTTIEIRLSRIHMVSGLVLERMWIDKGSSEIVMSLPCSRLSETSPNSAAACFWVPFLDFVQDLEPIPLLC